MAKNRKGAMNVGDLGPTAIAFVFVAVVIGVGATIMSSVQDSQVTATARCGLNSSGGTAGTLLYDGCGTDYNASGEGLTSLGELSSWLPLVALVVAAAIVIGVLSYFKA